MSGEPAGAADGAARRLRTTAETPAALAAVAAAAADWGGDWEPREAGGLLRLPVQAGLRHGLLEVAVAATALPAGGSELAFAVERAAWTIHRTAAGLLLMAAAGALAALLWPFVPALGPLAPLGVVLAVAAWLVVLARLRHHGLAELTEDVGERLESPAPADAAG